MYSSMVPYILSRTYRKDIGTYFLGKNCKRWRSALSVIVVIDYEGKGREYFTLQSSNSIVVCACCISNFLRSAHYLIYEEIEPLGPLYSVSSELRTSARVLFRLCGSFLFSQTLTNTHP
jgi:hypothetical protein